MNVILCCLCFLWETLFVTCVFWDGVLSFSLSLSLFLLYFLTFFSLCCLCCLHSSFSPFANVAFISLCFPILKCSAWASHISYLFIYIIIILGHTPYMHSPHTTSICIVLTALQGGNFNLSQYHMIFWFGQLFELA